MSASGSTANPPGGSVSPSACLAPRVFLQRRARVDRDLDPAVLLPSGFRAVGSDRLALPESCRRDVAGDSLGRQVPGRRLGAPLRERLVVLVAPDGVRV